MAPTIVVDNEMIAKATKEVVLKKIQEVLGGGKPESR
jgi:NADH:ubiquinone oxidoreductase subunit E